MKILSIDHLVITVSNIEAASDFYTRVLGMQLELFSSGRVALHFGNQKINLHQAHEPVSPKAKTPFPGSVDVCFVSSTSPDKILRHLQELGVVVELGPVTRTGARGKMESIYIRDPDQNLIELCCYQC
ncbi:catechol 2,3-dioxygenase-like lactoylglutathione lyase family enzyme [Alteromonadaceae bacterium 2753L.S.0a.02]|nr:catechol 2,3-dioxygenase-like lactoylglutathione lyase family enzyme [Alteromonadaceae bacterium 2753L.S.0a.02]